VCWLVFCCCTNGLRSFAPILMRMHRQWFSVFGRILSDCNCLVSSACVLHNKYLIYQHGPSNIVQLDFVFILWTPSGGIQLELMIVPSGLVRAIVLINLKIISKPTVCFVCFKQFSTSNNKFAEIRGTIVLRIWLPSGSLKNAHLRIGWTLLLEKRSIRRIALFFKLESI
jgi:hypothetical protein